LSERKRRKENDDKNIVEEGDPSSKWQIGERTQDNSQKNQPTKGKNNFAVVIYTGRGDHLTLGRSWNAAGIHEARCMNSDRR
jgi:hypothetical protein